MNCLSNFAKGINPGGRIFDHQMINKLEEVALIEEGDTGEVMWRYYNRDTNVKLDYNEEAFEDIWQFKEFIIKELE